MAQDTRDQWEEKNADKMLRFQWQVDPIKLDCTKTTADDKVTPVAINLCSLSKKECQEQRTQNRPGDTERIFETEHTTATTIQRPETGIPLG